MQPTNNSLSRHLWSLRRQAPHFSVACPSTLPWAMLQKKAGAASSAHPASRPKSVPETESVERPTLPK